MVHNLRKNRVITQSADQARKGSIIGQAKKPHFVTSPNTTDGGSAEYWRQVPPRVSAEENKARPLTASVTDTGLQAL
jgi:hypothetical protein